MAVTTRAPTTVSRDEAGERTFGFAAATLIAGGFGVALFGVITFIAERFVSLQGGLTFSTAVGPLSGKVIYSVIGWVISYGVLALVLHNRSISEAVTYSITGALFAIGFLLTFPPVWKLLGA